jgi:CTP:molybdopterin cytidylyltransferase MocA
MSDLHAVLLAAGGSSRLGRAKQLLTYAGEPLVHRGARLLTGITPRVTVVTGASPDEVGEALSDLDVEHVHNARWREGVGGSLALAARQFEAGTRATLILLCDQYGIESEQLVALSAAWREKPARITAAHWGERFGPPVIFPVRFFPRLRRLCGDLGARQLLVEERARVNFVDMPRAALDVDDAADLARMREFEARHRESATRGDGKLPADGS